MNHWKTYEPIARLSLCLDGIASLTELQVTACVAGRTPTPISISVEGCTVSLSPAKSAALRAQLERAENDVRLAAAQPVTATGTEGRCEHCSADVQPGERVIVEDDGTDDRVVLHAGQCPAQGGN